MSVSHVLKRKLQIRVHRTWSTDHNRNQTIKNWSNYIEVMGIFHEFLPKPLTTLLGRHLLPLRLSHSLCSYVGELAPDIKSPCPSISSVSQAQHVPKDVMKMSTSQPGLFAKTTNQRHVPSTKIMLWVQGQGDESELHLMFELRRMLRMSARHVTKWDCTVVMARFHKIQIHISERYFNIKVSAVHRYWHIVQVETHKGRTLYLYELETRDCWATRSWRGSSAKSSEMRNDQRWITCTAHHSTVHFRIR